MKLNTALVSLSLVGTAEAFAPQPMAAGTQRASLTELEMANGAKRKAALKAAKKVAGAVGSVALATAGLPPAARAAEAAVDSAKGAKNVVTVGAGAFAQRERDRGRAGAAACPATSFPGRAVACTSTVSLCRAVPD